MKEILKQAAKATKASQSQPKQAKASKRKQKQAIEPARAWVQNEFHCNKEHQPKSCENLPKTPQQPRIVHKGPESPRMFANSSQTFPKPSQNPPQIYKIEPKSKPDASKSTFENHSKYKHEKKELPKQPKKPQEPTNPSQNFPQTLPNGAQDVPKSDFWGFFWPVFFQSQICIDFLLLFCKICVVFQKPTFKFHAPTQCFVALHTV